ncbi:alpha-crystallin domain-containing protein 22.3-like [Solanum dulcamara]|uniref:alpha-crystallin domain-containing protein 22.3-like n=1 Tax=Solanum dulcamara TaxID=45834 RepID=UPI0024852E5E|nr:alpha-crystallin domain-containing protein 22.3-like [Solanum dulcamara]
MCIEYTYKADDVVQTGAAREGRAGVPNDPVTITVTEVAYKFKVVLPAVARSLSNLSYDIHPYGDVEIEGIVRSGEITSSVEPIICNRRTRRIFPQGHFTISFTLPGPADPNFARVNLNSNGVLEGSVLKRWIGHGDQSDSSD